MVRRQNKAKNRTVRALHEIGNDLAAWKTLRGRGCTRFTADQKCPKIGSGEVTDDGIFESSFQKKETVKMNRNRGANPLSI